MLLKIVTRESGLQQMDAESQTSDQINVTLFLLQICTFPAGTIQGAVGHLEIPSTSTEKLHSVVDGRDRQWRRSEINIFLARLAFHNFAKPGESPTPH